MKFIRTTTKAYLILLIFISSFLISINTETKRAKIRTTKRLSRSTASKSSSSKRISKHKKMHNKDDTMEN